MFGKKIVDVNHEVIRGVKREEDLNDRMKLLSSINNVSKAIDSPIKDETEFDKWGLLLNMESTYHMKNVSILQFLLR